MAPPEPGRWAGRAAAACAFLFALPSIYWGFGGTFLLDTVGRDAVELIEAGNVGVYVAVWFAALLKISGGVLALALVESWGRRLVPGRLLLLAGWGGAVLLVMYGAAQITVQLLVLSDVLVPPDDMDWRGFYGHLYLWDPWFVVWGVLLGVAAAYATRNARRRARGRTAPTGPTGP